MMKPSLFSLVVVSICHAQQVPDGWNCPVEFAQDEALDCFCGAEDPRSDGEERDVFCTVADTIPIRGASCDICPVVPAGWTCETEKLMDDICSCGCSAIDPECESVSNTACENGQIIEESNSCALCTEVPENWFCNPEQYDDKENCDCGCGAPDPDCDLETTDLTICSSTFNLTGSNCQLCEPIGWTECPAIQFGDGICDCNCGGIADPDCTEDTKIIKCDGIPRDGTKCQECFDVGEQAPDGWTCPDSFYFDDLCHCFCGIPDPSCCGDDENCTTTETFCSTTRSVEGSECSACDIDVPPNWSCNENFLVDTVCTCGCNAVDPECLGEFFQVGCVAEDGSSRIISGNSCESCLITNAPTTSCSGDSCDEESSTNIIIGACLAILAVLGLTTLLCRRRGVTGGPLTEEQLVEMRAMERRKRGINE